MGHAEVVKKSKGSLTKEVIKVIKEKQNLVRSTTGKKEMCSDLWLEESEITN